VKLREQVPGSAVLFYISYAHSYLLEIHFNIPFKHMQQLAPTKSLLIRDFYSSYFSQIRNEHETRVRSKRYQINRTVFLDKDRPMDNVQKHNSCTNETRNHDII
jgi:hypothetical protein